MSLRKLNFSDRLEQGCPCRQTVSELAVDPYAALKISILTGKPESTPFKPNNQKMLIHLIKNPNIPKTSLFQLQDHIFGDAAYFQRRPCSVGKRFQSTMAISRRVSTGAVLPLT